MTDKHNLQMDFEEVRKVVEGKPFYKSPLHDFTLKDDHISMLGIYEEDMIYMRTLISNDWTFVERTRNPENNFLRIDIMKK